MKNMFQNMVVALAVITAALVGSTLSQCLDGNCTDPQQAPVVRVDLGSIFPFPVFSPVDNPQGQFDEAIDPLQPVVNSTGSEEPQGGIMSISVMEVVSFDGDSDSEESSEEQKDDKFPGFPFQFDSKALADILGILDLSGSTLTGEGLSEILRLRQLLNQPVTSLILSNSRIQGLTASSLQPAQDTLQELRMDNCSINLDALSGLSSLKVLNLSNTGLSTFQWYPKLQDTLQVLDLSHNQFDEVRPELSALTSLTELYLSHNKITAVKEFPLSLLPNLEVLSLTMNALNDATLTKLSNLKELYVDWNYLWRCGQELQLPSHRVSVKLASNPWRCDCGLLQARDDHDVLDIDQLQCANSQSFTVCDDCQRYYLPMEEGRLVSNLTKDSIEHLGCTGLTDQMYLFRNAIATMREREPAKLFGLVMMSFGCFFLLLTAIALCRRQAIVKKKLNRQSWLKIQQIPYLKIDKLSKPKEVPYIKI